MNSNDAYTASYILFRNKNIWHIPLTFNLGTILRAAICSTQAVTGTVK